MGVTWVINYRFKMKRTIMLLILCSISLIQYGQIIADHTVVDRYEDIPQYYIDEVKKMWLSYAGESHSEGIRAGLILLENINPAYAVSVVESGTPEGYTTSNLRVSRATWGDVDNATGWIYSYGEEDWFTSVLAITRTKASIQYCDDNGPALSAFGFGWCWDLWASAVDYNSATDEYIAYCTANGIPTKVFYTTGPVDSWDGEAGYAQYTRYEATRSHVLADESRILFDFADILTHDPDGSTPNTATYEGHTYPIGTTTNLTPDQTYHFSEAGALRLAKAMWWMLARMAGWDGQSN